MPYEFKMMRLVEFAETDMAGIMHFSNYFRFMEATEHAFFRSLDLCVHAMPGAPGAGDGSGTGAGTMRGWARVNATCRYAAPLRYLDAVEMHLVVREKKPRAITYDFVFRKTAAPDRPAAFGSMTAVCIERPAGADTMRSVDMPADVDARIEVAPPELLASLEPAGRPSS